MRAASLAIWGHVGGGHLGESGLNVVEASIQLHLRDLGVQSHTQSARACNNKNIDEATHLCSRFALQFHYCSMPQALSERDEVSFDDSRGSIHAGHPAPGAEARRLHAIPGARGRIQAPLLRQVRTSKNLTSLGLFAWLAAACYTPNHKYRILVITLVHFKSEMLQAIGKGAFSVGYVSCVC